MYQYFDSKFQKQTMNIAPGEFFASGEDIMINTVLGSCVAVALTDPSIKFSGLNHFMLTKTVDMEAIKSREKYFNLERYGVFAMEALINLLLKAGGRKSNFVAKVFGGSSVLETKSSHMEIGKENIKFALEFLKTERIPVAAEDTGGVLARKIYLDVKDFRVKVRKIKTDRTNLDRLMKEYKERLSGTEDGGRVVLF